MSDPHADAGKHPSVEQKHPNDRAHIWDYANPHLETPAEPHGKTQHEKDADAAKSSK